MRLKQRIANAEIGHVVEGTLRRLTGAHRKDYDDKMAICNDCEHKVPDPALGGHACDICLCNLESKLNTSSPCPKNKF